MRGSTIDRAAESTSPRLRGPLRPSCLEQVLARENADDPVRLPVDDRHASDARLHDQVRNNAARRFGIRGGLRRVRERFGERGIFVECARFPSQRVRSRRERSEEHTSELQSLMRISYAVFCLKKKKKY